jgi:hypothetical protein
MQFYDFVSLETLAKSVPSQSTQNHIKKLKDQIEKFVNKVDGTVLDNSKNNAKKRKKSKKHLRNNTNFLQIPHPNLSRVFARKMKMSPSEYRKDHRL